MPESCSSWGELIAPPHRTTSPAPTYSCRRPGAEVLDADRAGALEAHLGGVGEGLDREVGAPHHRVQVGPRRRHPHAVDDVAVEAPEALLPVAVDVVGQGVARLLRRLEEGAEERVGGRAPLQPQRSRPPAPGVRADLPVGHDQRLHPLEVGQAVGVVPRLHPRVRGPPLVVHRVAALEDHPVDRGRPPEHLAAGVVDPTASHRRLRLRLVPPVVERVADREGQRARGMDQRVEPVRAPRLQHQHRGRAVGREPVGEGAPGRASTHDDDVVPVLAHV